MNINKEYKDIKMRATREVSEKKQERMKRKLLAATALMNYTKARDLHEDRDDLHEDREDLHEDREDLHEDRENLHEDRENLHEDRRSICQILKTKKTVHQDREDLHEDLS